MGGGVLSPTGGVLTPLWGSLKISLLERSLNRNHSAACIMNKIEGCNICTKRGGRGSECIFYGITVLPDIVKKSF